MHLSGTAAVWVSIGGVWVSRGRYEHWMTTPSSSRRPKVLTFQLKVKMVGSQGALGLSYWTKTYPAKASFLPTSLAGNSPLDSACGLKLRAGGGLGHRI